MLNLEMFHCDVKIYNSKLEHITLSVSFYLTLFSQLSEVLLYWFTTNTALRNYYILISLFSASDSL